MISLLKCLPITLPPKALEGRESRSQTFGL